MKNFCQTTISVALSTTITLGIAGKAHAVVLGNPLTGTYNVGRTSYYLTDNSREEILTTNPTDYRELIVQVFYPTKTTSGESASYINDNVIQKLEEIIPLPSVGSSLRSVEINAISGANIANTQSKYPVLLFSHGLGDIPESYTSFAENLASHGYIVSTISHSYDAQVTLFPDGRFATFNNSPLSAIFDEQTPDDTKAKLSTQATQIRAYDASFILNELSKLNANDPNNFLTGKLDLDNVGIFGHSTGGATAAEAMRLDSRFKAGINMDGTLWTDVVNTGLNQPFMLMNSGSSYEFDATRKTFYNNLQGDKYNLAIKNAKHHTFSDLPFLVSEYGFPDLFGFGEFDIKPDVSSKIINEYVLAFFAKYLKDENETLLKTRVSNELIDFTPEPRSVPEPTLPAGLLGIFSLYFVFNRQGSKTEV